VFHRVPRPTAVRAQNKDVTLAGFFINDEIGRERSPVR
jgi:hypothetical protein